MTPAVSRRRKLRRLLCVLAGAVLLVALSLPTAVGVLLASFSGTRPQDLEDRATPWDYGVSYRTVLLSSEDGVRVASWLLRARRPAGCSVVLAHGLFRSRREVLDRAAYLVERGCHALTLDLRRHGDSGGTRTSLGFLEGLDVMAGARFLRREFPENRLYLLGVSMGGAAAARAGAAMAADVTGVVLDSTFRNVPEVIDRYAALLVGLPPFPAGDLTLLGLELTAGFEPREMDVERFSARLGGAGVPVLVIAGDGDRRAPLDAQAAVFRANGHPASRMIVVEDATHGRPCLLEPRACEKALGDFLDLPPEEAGTSAKLLYDPGP
ncbi:MAG: alpha/beta hydrolase [Acidobacteria bacterium]|nr:alpha/beta hydrolase [Acidobacteriota bacterium]MYE44342.1 alpha/beta hydrolase [Acidobacteriota bacterium]